jgi:hypothetical protein
MKKAKKIFLCASVVLVAFACKKSSSSTPSTVGGTVVLYDTTLAFSGYGFASTGEGTPPNGSAVDSELYVVNSTATSFQTYTPHTPDLTVAVYSPNPIKVGAYVGGNTSVSVSTAQYFFSSQQGASDSVVITNLTSSYVSGTYRVTIDTATSFPQDPADTMVVRGTFGAAISQ